MVSIKTNEMTTLETFLTNHFIKIIFVRYNFNAEMSPMKPVFTDDTLQHHVVDRVIGVWVRSAACTVQSAEVVVVAVVIRWFLVRTQFTRHHSTELAVAAVTTEVSLCIQLS